jgi:hypothetical protein
MGPMNKLEDKFSAWCLIDLFGHSRIAGLVTEQAIGGCSFLRVDVPATGEEPAFTKCFGNGAIYGMTFVTEEVARAAAKSYRVVPVTAYEIPELRQLRLPKVDGKFEEHFDDDPADEPQDEEYR